MSSSGYGSHGASHDSRVARLEIAATNALLKGIGSPRALTVALLLQNGEWDQLLDLKIDPNNYFDSHSFMDDYLVTSVLQKNQRLPTSIDKKAVAIRKFYDAEKLCSETNARIRDFREDPRSVGSDIITTVLNVQSIIQRVIGPYPTRNELGYIESKMRFGPGATTSLSGVVTQGRKFSNNRLDCTEDLVAFRTWCFPEVWKPIVTDLNVVQGSRLTTVPKNAKTDRCICIEPDLNIFIQLGIGASIRRKLRHFGLDLKSQEGNQVLASTAWTRDLATVDLSAASDTISHEVVRLLLPPEWVRLLEFPRCPMTNVDGDWVTLEKWSSMGNGYTFELESLIFYAVALAVTDVADWDSVRVFGDDIIIPNSSMSALLRALNFLGFRVNEDKTFGKGLFHESCGTDWFMGRNVRPFFLRSDFHDLPSVCYLYANNARRWASRRNGGWSLDKRCLPFWLRCFTAVGSEDAHKIPEGFGDVGFIVDFDDAVPTIRKPKGNGWGGYWFSYRRIRSIERVVSQEGCLTAFLSGKCTDFSLGREALRGRYQRAALELGHTHVWPNLGPWL